MANCLYLHDSYITKFDFVNYAFANLIVAWLQKLFWNKIEYMHAEIIRDEIFHGINIIRMRVKNISSTVHYLNFPLNSIGYF